MVKDWLRHFTDLGWTRHIFMLLAVIAPTIAWPAEAPELEAIECYDIRGLVTGWAITPQILVALQGVTGSPVWVDIDEDPEFGSPYSIKYTSQISAQMRGLTGHTDLAAASAFSRDGLMVVTGSMDMTARLWDTSHIEAVTTFAEHGDGIDAVDISPDASLVATGSGDMTARLWDAQTGEVAHILKFGAC